MGKETKEEILKHINFLDRIQGNNFNPHVSLAKSQAFIALAIIDSKETK